ncbi:FRG domain-containing protein [Pedobacter sp.]|uniref:FRG domain-containing protein n=1 Tax=Pedobacter sp. TaxID=1411316 RepID=UPI003D7F8B79
MKQIELENVEVYLNLIKSLKQENLNAGNDQDFLFRGQTSDSPLLPKICRLEAKMDVLDAEKLLLKEFKRTNPLLIKEQHALDDWDYLTLGQHFGLPTRLLDWSNNALTALWFATGESNSYTLKNEPDAVVWILMAHHEDIEPDMETLYPFDVPSMKIIRPRIIKQRINNQSGLFSISSSRDVLEKRAINELDSFKDKLVKVKIASEKLMEIRTDLNTLGVNAFTIFPELEGLCNYLQWRYFK